MSTFIFLSIGGGSGTNIPVVANYNALIAAYPPPNTTHLGQFVFVENAQGTWWIPGPILGTYYPAGLYYCNGVDWKTADVPYQAAQAEVDAGTVTDKFVSPETLEGKPLAITRTGTSIAFDKVSIYNEATPATGNLTDDLTGARIGIVQKIYHNATVAPVPPAGWVKLGTGSYTPSTLNIIFAEWVSGTRVEYWIVKGS
jgi:hypothetical protein